MQCKSKVKFYDLKTRLQMFFLYQRGFISGKDNDKDINYRSQKGADDGTTLARTLWEYAMCNMDSKEHFAKGDQGKDFYNITYSSGNHEIKAGSDNMLKQMWNIACALDLGKDTYNGKTKLDIAKENTDAWLDNKGNFKDAVISTFSLFHSGEFGINIEDDDIKVTINKRENEQEEQLNFNITQVAGHARVTHNPIKFNWDEKFNDPNYNFDEAKLLLSYFVKSMSTEEERPSISISKVKEFYRAFFVKDMPKGSQEPLYKKLKALNVFKILQNAGNNIGRISLLLDFNGMDGAKEIKVKMRDDETKKDLSDIFYEKFLIRKKFNIRGNALYAINSYAERKFGKIKNIYSSDNKISQQEITNFDVVRISENNEIFLILKDIPKDGNLTIPAKVYDENGKEFKVIRVSKAKSTELGNLKTVKYDGDFEKLTIENSFFENCKNLEKVEFSGNFENLKIDGGALKSFKNLTTLEISGTVTNLEICEEAFNECEKLETFKISGTVTNLEIGRLAFAGCENLKNFEIPENVKNLKLDEMAFSGCANLETFTISETVANLTIDGHVFDLCKELKTLIIPQNVEELSVDESAFNASYIKNLCVPEALKSKMPEKMSNPKELKIYYYTGAIPTIEEIEDSEDNFQDFFCNASD